MTIKVSNLYEMIRAHKSDLENLQVSMQQVTGDATPSWEDTVQSEVKSNITLHTLYRRFKWTRKNLNILLDKDVVKIVPEDMCLCEPPNDDSLDEEDE